MNVSLAISPGSKDFFYQGAEHPFKPGDFKECTAIAALELIRNDQSTAKNDFVEKVEAGQRNVSWTGEKELQIVLPLRAPTKEESYQDSFVLG